MASIRPSSTRISPSSTPRATEHERAALASSSVNLPAAARKREKVSCARLERHSTDARRHDAFFDRAATRRQQTGGLRGAVSDQQEWKRRVGEADRRQRGDVAQVGRQREHDGAIVWPIRLDGDGAEPRPLLERGLLPDRESGVRLPGDQGDPPRRELDSLSKLALRQAGGNPCGRSRRHFGLEAHDEIVAAGRDRDEIVDGA